HCQPDAPFENRPPAEDGTGRWMRGSAAPPDRNLETGASASPSCKFPPDFPSDARQSRRKEGTLSALDIGDIAPPFTLPTDDGGMVSSSGLKGRKFVLYFYPADDTKSCTAEAIDFSAMAAAFEATGTTIIGVSPDSLAKHAKFRAKHALTVRLAADPDH